MSSTPATTEEHLIAIGKLLHNASSNEIFMLKAFQILSSTTAKTAQVIFYTFDALPGRINLLERTCKACGDEQDNEIVEKIIRAAEKSNNQRKQVAHSLVIYESQDLDSSKKSVNPKSMFNAKQVSSEWLNELLKQSGNAVLDGIQANEELCQKHGKSPSIEIE